MGGGEEVLRGEAELEASDAGAHVDVLLFQGAGVDVGGEGLLHADGGTTSSDIAGCGEELFHVDEVAALVAGGFGGHLEVYFFICRNNAYEESCTVSLEYQGFEHGRAVFSQLLCHMYGIQMFLIYLIGNQGVRDIFPVQDSCSIGFLNLHFLLVFKTALFLSYSTVCLYQI